MVPVHSHQGMPAPDGGWGWFVVLASFLLQALTIGITYTYGVLFVPLLKEFGESEALTSFIGSIQPAVLYFTGIITAPLIKKFGCRVVTICGSLLSAVGFFTSSFSPNVYLLYLTYGVLTGVGNGLIYLSSMVAVQHWFEKRRALATGLAVSGCGIGTLTFGYLTQILVDDVGWRNTLRIQAAMFSVGIMCGMLYRPLPEKSHVDKKNTNIDEQYNHDEIKEENAGCGNCTEFVNLSLYKNPIFVIFCISLILFCFGYHVPYTYTPERAQRAFGIFPRKASFLLSIMGVANVLSRLIFGWIGDRSPEIRFILGGTTLTIGGLVSCFIHFCTTYSLMVLYCMLFGTFTGCWISLFPTILVDLLGVDNIEQALGQCLCGCSIAYLMASPMSGYILQKTGNYDIPFEVDGAAEAVGGVLFFAIWLIKHKEGKGYSDIEDGH